MNMKINSHDLAVEYTMICEFTQTTEARTVSNQKVIIEIFKLKSFVEAIKPKLMNMKDLTMPR